MEHTGQGTGRFLLIGALVVATILSFALIGYTPILSNNVYHLPILFGSYDLPQFESDAFVQSMPGFPPVSGSSSPTARDISIRNCCSGCGSSPPMR